MNKFIVHFILISYFLTGTYFINKYDKSKIFYFICATIFSAIFIYFIKFSTIGYLSYQTKYYLVWYYVILIACYIIEIHLLFIINDICSFMLH